MHRGLDRLLATAEQQRLRQMKRIYLMQRHVEKQAALARAQREKAAKDRLREQATEAAAQRARAERQLQEALAEVRSHLLSGWDSQLPGPLMRALSMPDRGRGTMSQKKPCVLDGSCFFWDTIALARALLQERRSLHTSAGLP